ncbi:MAG: desulfoferrodoxin family protein [Clostridia bacterium]
MQELEVYICDICKNIVMFLQKSFGKLTCCNEPMRKILPNSVQADTKKHMPIGVFDGDNIIVEIGSIQHPMTEEHAIKWIYIVTDEGLAQKRDLNVGDIPKAIFQIGNAKRIDIYAYCNLHGLWKSTVEK